MEQVTAKALWCSQAECVNLMISISFFRLEQSRITHLQELYKQLHVCVQGTDAS